MVRPTLSSFSVVFAACALVVVSGASVWQPGDAQAILTQSAGLHGHLPRWIGAVVDTAKAIEQKKRVDEDHHRYRQSKPDTPVDITFKNMNDGQDTYAATFFIGTPPQPVTLSLDLLTTDLNVVNHKLDGHQYYDHDKSSSYKANGTKVGAGGIQGFASSDSITLGDPATHNIKLQNQLFVEMTGKDEVLQRLSADGFFGFGRYNESTWINGVRGPIQSLIHNGQLEEPIVGLYMDEQEAHTMIGGIDSMYTSGPVTYFSPAREDFTWGVPVVGVAVGGKTISGGAGRGLITSILAGIGGPKAQVDAIAKAIGVKDGLLACNATTPDVTFQITEGLKVTLTKKDYMWPTPDDNVCEFAMIHSPLSHEWMFGTPFLRNVYTVLDYSKDTRTGLAPLRVHA